MRFTPVTVTRRGVLACLAGAALLGPMALGLATAHAQTHTQAEGGLLAVGAHAPAISAQDQDGHTRTLAEFHGHPVVLYFYPRDATPGCTTEACGFRDAWARYQSAGAQVLGVSFDDVASHQRFAHDQHLPFPLLADPHGVIVGHYGVPHSGSFASRVTFLIDGQGVVRHVYPNVDPSVHATEVLTAIQALPH